MPPTSGEQEHLNVSKLLKVPDENDEERKAFLELQPPGFFIRPPPKPHQLHTFITPDHNLFQTIHMGAAVVDVQRWMLVVTGLVQQPYALDLELLKQFPRTTITSFHECFGSPIKPAIEALWRVGNVQWTGVRLKDILYLAQPLPQATFVWSEGLDRGTFHGVDADRYQKDLPLTKALSDEVLLAYEINGRPLDKERGGPVRLVVPGWFGTNSTKWISKLTLQDHRAMGPYTTTFYNVPEPSGPPGATRPVWQVEVNSLISRPEPGSVVEGCSVLVEGWAWHEEPVQLVEISVDGGSQWRKATLKPRVDFSWQSFHTDLEMAPGPYIILARATSSRGDVQPLRGHRNHSHCVNFTVV